MRHSGTETPGPVLLYISHSVQECKEERYTKGAGAQSDERDSDKPRRCERTGASKRYRLKEGDQIP